MPIVLPTTDRNLLELMRILKVSAIRAHDYQNTNTVLETPPQSARLLVPRGVALTLQLLERPVSLLIQSPFLILTSDRSPQLPPKARVFTCPQSSFTYSSRTWPCCSETPYDMGDSQLDTKNNQRNRRSTGGFTHPFPHPSHHYPRGSRSQTSRQRIKKLASQGRHAWFV